jgi:hypothetical protein
MNCKPGDLAYIARLPAALGEPFTSLVGRVVTVTEITQVDPIVWRIKTPIVLPFMGARIHVTGVEDAYLRPISGVPVYDEVRDEVTA